MITHGPGRQGPGGARNARTGVNLLGVPPGRFLLLCGATLALSVPLLAAAGGPPACTYEDWPATHVAYDDYPFTILDTVFALPEVRLGLVPGAGGTASLPARIGRHRTARLALTGERIDAATAHRWGLVDELVD